MSTTKQIELIKQNGVYKVRLRNKHRDWDVKDDHDFDDYTYEGDDFGDAYDVFEAGMKELLSSIADKYTESHWWKQIVRRGEDKTDGETYGVSGVAGLGNGDVIDTPRMVNVPDRILVSTEGRGTVALLYDRDDELVVDKFKHMTANEVNTYQKNV